MVGRLETTVMLVLVKDDERHLVEDDGSRPVGSQSDQHVVAHAGNATIYRSRDARRPVVPRLGQDAGEARTLGRV